MFVCPQCGSQVATGDVCSRCGGERDTFPEPGRRRVANDGTDDWETIARFGNAAEAGYFANELHYVLDFEPRLECRDDFDTLGNLWRSSYALSVPEELADHARRQFELMLRGEAAASFSSVAGEHAPGEHDAVLAEDADVGSSSTERRPVSGVNWVPIMLTLAAGSLVLWSGKKLHVQRLPGAAPGRAQRIDVWDALSRDGSRWSQPFPEGGGVRELLIQREEGTAVVREDADGDGDFERETLYDIDRN